MQAEQVFLPSKYGELNIGRGFGVVVFIVLAECGVLVMLSRCGDVLSCTFVKFSCCHTDVRLSHSWHVAEYKTDVCWQMPGAGHDAVANGVWLVPPGFCQVFQSATTVVYDIRSDVVFIEKMADFMVEFV